MCALNTGYEFHLGARLLLGVAAGQSEALVPLMIKEMFFISDRASVLAFQSMFNGICGAILSMFVSHALLASYRAVLTMRGTLGLQYRLCYWLSWMVLALHWSFCASSRSRLLPRLRDQGEARAGP